MDINTSGMQLYIQKQLHQAQEARKEEDKAQSSGHKINSAKDDAAGLIVSLELRANMHLAQQNIRQSQDHLSSMQIVDAQLQGSTEMMLEMRDLALQASNGAYGSAERHRLDQQFHALQDELGRQRSQKALAPHQQYVKQQISSEVVAQFDQAMADLAAQDIRDLSQAQHAIEALDTALLQSTQVQAELGAQQNIEIHRQHAAQSHQIALAESNSKIEDTDYGEALLASTKAQVKQEINVLLATQSTPSPKKVAHLIG